MTDAASTKVLLLEKVKTRAKSFFANGEYFQAYDTIIEALDKYPNDPWLRHRAVLSLANAGACSLACRKYIELRLHTDSSIDALTLGARLIKDIAYSLPEGSDRLRMLTVASEAYERIFLSARDSLKAGAYYPGINAATLALFAGRPDRAVELANDVGALVCAEIAAARLRHEAPDYWLLATAIEAALLSSDIDTAIALLPDAIAASEGDLAWISSTGRQLERVLKAKGIDTSPFAEFIPPPVIHYTGHLMAPPGTAGRFSSFEEGRVAARIASELGKLKPAFGYGSLASGADILFAEALLARGAQAHVVLPFAEAEFVEKSVKPAGEAWLNRYDACVKRCKAVRSGPKSTQNTLRFATEEGHHGYDQLFFYCSQLAMGLAVLRAKALHTTAHQLAIWDGVATDALAGTVRDLVTWRKAGHPSKIIRCGERAAADDLTRIQFASDQPGFRQIKAMLFGDFKGFSKLPDGSMPKYVEKILKPLSAIVHSYGAAVSSLNTWGDGLFIVFDDAGKAASAALDLQEAMEAIDLEAAGLPLTMKLRLGGHLGPVHELMDPFLLKRNYFGAHVSRSARIEPITPEGCVYVTETFAAVLALHNVDEFTCEYVGYTEMAKHYGQLRMFLLNRARMRPESLKSLEIVVAPLLGVEPGP